MRPVYPTVRALARPLLRLLYRLEVRDALRLPATGSMSVVANRESLLDPIGVERGPSTIASARALTERLQTAVEQLQVP